MADSTRQLKVSRLIQKELSEIFRAESLSLFQGKMITVTTVRISPDLSVARVYLSLFQVEKPQEFVAMINEKEKEVRKRVATNVRFQLRIVPHFTFFVDDSLDYFEKIDQLLQE